MENMLNVVNGWCLPVSLLPKHYDFRQEEKERRAVLAELHLGCSFDWWGSSINYIRHVSHYISFLFFFTVGWGLLASPVGFWLSRYINKWGYKIVLAFLLIVNSITMITTSSISLVTVD